MIYTTEVQHMCPVAKGAYHGPAPIPEEGKWVQAKQISDISGFTHGVGWCAPQQGLADQDLGSHSGGVGHAGAAQGLDQSLLDDALLNVQGQLASALLRCAPAHAVGEAADVLDALGLNPLTLFGNGSRTVVSALTHGAHVLYFCTVNHGKNSFLF